MGFCQKIIGINAGGQHGCKLSYIRIWFYGSCQDDHVGFFFDLLIVQQVHALHQKLSIRLRDHFSYLSFDVIHTILLYSSSVELIKVLTRCTHINIKYRHIYIRVFITDQHSMLGGVHTTDLGTVALSSVVCTTASNTLDEYHLFRCLSVRQTFQMSFGWSGRIHDPLQFQRGDNIFTLAVCIFIIIVKLDHIKTSSNYDCSIFLCNDLILLVIVNSSGLTYF